MAKVIISIGAYLVPSSNTLINLAFYPDNTVCGKLKAQYRISTLTFLSTSLVYNTNDTPAQTGWYSDGANKAYWDGESLTNFSACVLISITLDSYNGTEVLFTISGGSISALNMMTSVDAGVTWTSDVISSVSPFIGLTMPTTDVLIKLQSADDAMLFSNTLFLGVLRNFYFEGTWEEGDTRHPLGATVFFVNEFGMTDSEAGLYVGECRLITAQSIISNIGARPCVLPLP